MDNTYSISEVAEKLNLSDKTLRRWEEAGKFASPRTLGNQRRYTIEDLQILDAIKHGTIPDQKDLLTREQAALLLGVSPVTVDRYVSEGKIHPFITVGNTFFPRHILEKKMAELKNHEPAPIHFDSESANNSPSLDSVKSKPTVPPSSNTSPLSTPSLVPQNSLSTLNYKPYLINIVITIVGLTIYHLIFGKTTTIQSPSQPTSGSVQGASTISPQILNLLEDTLDSSGNITGNSITAKLGLSTPVFSLLPTSLPLSPTSGTIYYDGSAQTLKLYTGSSWVTLTTNQTLQLATTNLESSIASLSAEINTISATSSSITR